MAEPTYALSWPRELFEWEAKRILDTGSGFPADKIALLLEEAFEDADVAEQFRRMGPAVFSWTSEPQTNYASAEEWFTALLNDKTRLRPFQPPRYWAQRNNVHQQDEGTEPLAGFAGQFFDLIKNFSETGYTPKVMPKWCPDADNPSEEWISRQISSAIRIPVAWEELTQNPGAVSDDLIYSLVEYFHDQAQRPRTYSTHEYGGCGRHYSDYDAIAGRTIYRWRLNQLLRDHNIPLQLAAKGDELGRLVREFSPPFQDLVESQVTARTQPGDEIAHAIRDFRSRGASIVVKRTAITLIANNFETRRQALKAHLKKDEQDLFNIANNFKLRHRNDGQKEEYGHEFADWIFWNFLAAVELLDALERRGSGE